MEKELTPIRARAKARQSLNIAPGTPVVGMVGEMLAKGIDLAEIPQRLGGQVAEGISTAEATYQASLKRGVVMPITEQTHLVLSEGKPIREAMREGADRGDAPWSGRSLRSRACAQAYPFWPGNRTALCGDPGPVALEEQGYSVPLYRR